MSPLTIVLLVLGFVLLVVGAELLVRGAARFAARVGIPQVVVGLTVVSYGTSAPELAVSVNAALTDSADLAVGNVVGSNIFNVLVVLGLSAVIAPLIVSRRLVRLDVPIMIAVSVLLMVLVMDRTLGRVEGLILLAGTILYTTWTVVQGRRDERLEQAVEAQKGTAAIPASVSSGWDQRLPVQLALIVIGLALLVQGATWLVDGAVELAELFGVSELIIGLTVIAVGTSLPEIATSILAVTRGQRDIAVGNVVGSNIYNILLILGVTSTISPIVVPPAVPTFELPVMTAVAVACLPVFFTGMSIGRWEGVMFLGYYVAYTLFLFLRATEHDALPAFSGIMLWFVVPITAVTLAATTFRAVRQRRAMTT